MNAFFAFAWKKKDNRPFVLAAVAGILIQWVLFKWAYPYPDFFSDSYSYIATASRNLDISIWPIGYSKFLRAFHALTHSDTALVSFQFFFLEITALYFFTTLRYFYALSRRNSRILAIALFFNPLLLYFCNYVNSDPIFCALSLWWMTELIWILNRPRAYQVFTQALLLFLAFTVRNNAYVYPLIAGLVFLLSRAGWRFKVSGILLGPLLILPFVLYTESAAQQLTGTRQFSLFTGWMLANNALYMREYIQVSPEELQGAASPELDSLAKAFFRTVKDEDGYRENLANYPGNYFVREPRAPLKVYFARHNHYTPGMDLVKAWGKASADFAPYGKSLILHHPLAYARYFMGLNLRDYLLPPLEKLEVYNLGEDEVDASAKDWFDYPTAQVHAIDKDVQGYILYIFPVLFAVLHVFLLFWIGTMLYKGRYRALPLVTQKTLWVLGAFLLANCLFCLFATIIVLRYEVFPGIVVLSMVLLCQDSLGEASRGDGNSPAAQAVQ
ncbi:MAG: hypothetical protein P4L51_28455 [Puia sp.]|nr:hypothetical protein [Puia sp.]